MMDESSEDRKHTGKETMMSDMLAWIGSVQLTEQEAEEIKNSILEDATGYRSGWFELVSSRIDRTVARSQRTIDQAVARRLQLQTDRIERRRMTGVRHVSGGARNYL